MLLCPTYIWARPSKPATVVPPYNAHLLWSVHPTQSIQLTVVTTVGVRHTKRLTSPPSNMGPSKPTTPASPSIRRPSTVVSAPYTVNSIDGSNHGRGASYQRTGPPSGHKRYHSGPPSAPVLPYKVHLLWSVHPTQSITLTV